MRGEIMDYFTEQLESVKKQVKVCLYNSYLYGMEFHVVLLCFMVFRVQLIVTNLVYHLIILCASASSAIVPVIYT